MDRFAIDRPRILGSLSRRNGSALLIKQSMLVEAALIMAGRSQRLFWHLIHGNGARNYERKCSQMGNPFPQESVKNKPSHYCTPKRRGTNAAILSSASKITLTGRPHSNVCGQTKPQLLAALRITHLAYTRKCAVAYTSLKLNFNWFG